MQDKFIWSGPTESPQTTSGPEENSLVLIKSRTKTLLPRIIVPPFDIEDVWETDHILDKRIAFIIIQMNDSISRGDRAFLGHICPSWVPRSWPAVISCSCYSESSGVPSPDEIESDQVPNYSLKAAAGWVRKTGDWSLESPQLTGNACCGSCWQPGCVFFLNPKCRSTLFICQNNFWQARCSPFVCKFIFRSQFVGIFWTYNLYKHKLLHVPCTIHSTWSNTATVVRPQNDSNKLKFKINFSQFGTRVYKLWVSWFAILLFDCYNNAQAAVCIRRITEFRRLYYISPSHSHL